MAAAKVPGVMSRRSAPPSGSARSRASAFKPIREEHDSSGADPLLDGARPSTTPASSTTLKKVTVGMNKRYTLEAAEKLRDSDLPILLTWAPGDRVFPIKFAERLAGEVPNARIPSRSPTPGTFVPLDQPERLAQEIAEFAASS